MSEPLCLETGLLHVMKAKLCWGLHKLGEDIDAAVLESIQAVMENNASIISQRWAAIQQKNTWTVDPATFCDLDFDRDRSMDLPELNDFITDMMEREKNARSAAFCPKSDLVLYPIDTLPSGFGDHKKDGAVLQNLHGIETWVERNLFSWYQAHQADASACGQLANLIRKYTSTAMKHYERNPKSLSGMILVVLELWIVCDRIGIAVCPLLDDYCPGVPKEPLQNLLLPHQGQMDRLHRIEKYLTTRSQSLRSFDDIFRLNKSPHCFAARYFDQSIDHQTLRKKIEERATYTRMQRLEQLASLKASYETLMNKYRQSQCEYYEVENRHTGVIEDRHSPSSCTSCRYKTQADALQIEVHEWPLPDNSTEAKSVTFELRLPPWFGHWRESTLFVILDVLKSQYNSTDRADSRYHLSADKQLKSLFVKFNPGDPQRVGLLSMTKPHIGTHRRGKQISTATEDSICLRSGLTYRYHDSATVCFVDQIQQTDRVPHLCTYGLPSPALQKYIFRPAHASNGPPPNEIIADQSACPQHMTLAQWKALAAIPLGQNLQYLNLATQLYAPVVDFKKIDTVLVVFQCIHQAGPPSKLADKRVGHETASTEGFAKKVLAQLGVALQRIKQNWEFMYALCAFAAIARRLLSLSSDRTVQVACLEFLHDARVVAFDWIKVLQGRANDTQPVHREEYSSRAVEAALICASTLDVDRRYLETVLAATSDASILIQSCIIIHEGGRSLLSSTKYIAALLHSRHARLLHDAFPTLARSQEALHSAISESWSAYQPGQNWTVSENASHWVVTQTAPTAGNNGSVVHYDLLSGRFLVDGQPVGRLPSDYEGHASYALLFGHSIIEVMPASAIGLSFSAKALYSGYKVQFGLGAAHKLTEPDLLVQALKESSGTIYELLPPRLFQESVPSSFVRDFVHWYDRSTGDIEFRPANEPWTVASPGEWRLVKGDDSKWRLTQPRNERFLVAMTSPTAHAVTKILSPLAQPPFIHLTLSKSLSSLDIDIPSLRVGFKLNHGSANLLSREFPHMYVSEEQSVGTLVGFRNMLLLTHTHTDEQKLLLLEGEISSRRCIGNPDRRTEPLTDHVDISVDQRSHCKVHSFDIDKRLGRLVDNGSMQSQLVLAYLHAHTAFCVPDPLTQTTGTEEALAILKSASIRSFSKLRPENVSILAKIGNLTPKPVFYPEHERVMQSIQWSSQLSFLSQHAAFHTDVMSILDRAKRYDDLFFQSGTLLPVIQGVNVHLLERGRIRSAALYVSGRGAEEHTTQYDDIYNPRDLDQNSKRRVNAYVLSSHISRRRETFHSCLPSAAGLWDFLQRSPSVLGPKHGLDVSHIKYDAMLLQDGGTLISQAWPSLHRVLSERLPVNEFNLALWLSAIACSKAVAMSVLETVALFHTSGHFRDIHLAPFDSFNVSAGYLLKPAKILQNIRLDLRSFHNSPEADLQKLPHEKRRAFGDRRYRIFLAQQNSAMQYLATVLQDQWPCESPEMPEIDAAVDVSSYINVEDAIRTNQSTFITWYKNRELFQYLQRIEDAARPISLQQITVSRQTLPSPGLSPSQPGFVSAASLFRRQAPSLQRIVHALTATPSMIEQKRDLSRLQGLITDLERDACSSAYEQRYVDNLKTSVGCLSHRVLAENCQVPSYETLKAHLESCEEQERQFYNILRCSVLPKQGDHPASKFCECAQMWLRLTPRFFIQQLAKHHWSTLSVEWRACIVEYAIAITLCHRAERLIRARRSSDEDAMKELQNEGHTNWDPMEYPERLLLEVESRILIRDVQSDVAKEMEKPQSGSNTSMQLNMGEGKSSVIAPMVAAALADGSRLVRIIVAKPQSKQMAQMLISKLGGMIGRCVYFMPFSRKIRLDEVAAQRMCSLYRECMEQGGIVLLQPENILSFQLMGLERCISGEQVVGRSLLLTQQFFNQTTRDIVDESDENFSVKFELIYSMGTQQHIDGSADRWLCIQEVLNLVSEISPAVARDLPSSMEVVECAPGGFPRIRILRRDAEVVLLERVARRLCDSGLVGFPISRQPPPVRQAVFTYLTKWDLSEEEIQRVESSSSGAFWTESIRPKLFLLRGLLAHGILTFVFRHKRWRVNYGLDTTRTPPTRLAVPYRAKDMPTARSEFSHPDVVIILTLLCYYYGGLTDEHIHDSLDHLVQSDQKDVEYDRWVKCVPALPAAFRQLDGINLQDRPSCTSYVFPMLRLNKKVVDYFLAHVVFPKEIKEFPNKLSASGWDIGRAKPNPTTAFSGTSDSHILLPLEVGYFDSQAQRHTNAVVLDYLLRVENSVQFIPMAAGALASNGDAGRLLATVVNMNPPPRVLLDAGAQILEMGNLEVARTWLHMYPCDRVRAAVFFDENDDLTVLTKEGHAEPLQTSPFASQLDTCIIFLDQAHTRGTDLKLPTNYRAAVTLGANLTKDRLVQACMRMRKLGEGQSVVFCVTDEIRTKISDHTLKSRGAGISVEDVLRWAVSETYEEIRQCIPLWAEQGRRYIRHEGPWDAISQRSETSLSLEYARKFLEPERQTLENRYGPHSQEHVSAHLECQRFSGTRAAHLWERCSSVDGVSFRGSRLQEEQERELSPETQQERQNERPPVAEPARHCVHKDVIGFVNAGRLIRGSDAYMPAFEAFEDTSLAERFPMMSSIGDGRLLVTADFVRTIRKNDKLDVLDNYQRPVQWILTTASESGNLVDRAMIISPYEAQELFPAIRQSEKVVLHNYQPRWNRAYPSLDNLDYIAVPELELPRQLPLALRAQVNVFAGQLFYSSFQDYEVVCHLLGLASDECQSGWTIGADGFIYQDSQGKTGGSSALQSSPVPVVKELTRLRRDGESIANTHAGRMLEGALLKDLDFEEAMTL